jgi:hypothetical protein
MKARLLVILLVITLSAGIGETQGQAPVLGIQGDHFTVNGEPKFLLFVSYFDAMRRSNAGGNNSGNIDDDLSYLKQRGFDGIRIFPNWWEYDCNPNDNPDYGNDTLFTGGNTLRSGKLAVLERVLDRAAYYGLIVDVSFSRESVDGLGGINPTEQDFEDYEKQLELVTTALDGDHPHVFFDLQNEYRGNQTFKAHIQEIATTVRAQDPQRIILASTGASSGEDGRNAQETAGFIVGHADLDVAGVHPRREDSTWHTNSVIADAIADSRSGMDDGGLSSPYAPVYLQEPMPYSKFTDQYGNCGTDPDEATGTRNTEAAIHAKVNGAAAYTFHTRTTFDLSEDK